MASPRYLIGQGEKLSEEISRPPRGMGDKAHPYSFNEARRRLAPQWKSTAKAIESLPDLACPGGEAALEVTLHPSYLAKSYYPGELIRELGLHHLGSRAVHIVPHKVVAARAEESGKAQPAPVLYLAGNADRLVKFSIAAAQWAPNDEKVEDAFRRIESVTTPGHSRLKSLSTRFENRDNIPLEVVLHNPEELGNSVVIRTFAKFMRSLGVHFDLDRQRQAGGLAFLPIIAPRNRLDDVLNFSFLRALREAPRIVPFDPVARSLGRAFPVVLAGEDATAPDLSVAIFDGGLPDNHLLDIVTRESQRLNGIITDFLAYSRGKQFHFEKADLARLLEDTLTLMRHRMIAENTGITIESRYPAEAWVMADGDRMKQVFWNIAENAVRAMTAGGTLRVSIERMGEDWQISFADTGTGMTAQQTEKIFEPFQSNFEGGTGLGLAVVYQIMQAHEGKVWARSKAGQGTTFVLRLRRFDAEKLDTGVPADSAEAEAVPAEAIPVERFDGPVLQAARSTPFAAVAAEGRRNG